MARDWVQVLFCCSQSKIKVRGVHAISVLGAGADFPRVRGFAGEHPKIGAMQAPRVEATRIRADIEPATGFGVQRGLGAQDAATVV